MLIHSRNKHNDNRRVAIKLEVYLNAALIGPPCTSGVSVTYNEVEYNKVVSCGVRAVTLRDPECFVLNNAP